MIKCRKTKGGAIYVLRINQNGELVEYSTTIFDKVYKERVLESDRTAKAMFLLEKYFVEKKGFTKHEAKIASRDMKRVGHKIWHRALELAKTF